MNERNLDSPWLKNHKESIFHKTPFHAHVIPRHSRRWQDACMFFWCKMFARCGRSTLFSCHVVLHVIRSLLEKWVTITNTAIGLIWIAISIKMAAIINFRQTMIQMPHHLMDFQTLKVRILFNLWWRFF